MKRYVVLSILVLSFLTMLFSGMKISVTKAAPDTGKSVEHETDLSTDLLSVVLIENGEETEDELLSDLADLDTMELGLTYKEEIAAKNDGDYDEYVRAVVRKYFTDEEGKETTDVDLDYIVLVPADDSNWKINRKESTAERTVYYLLSPLDAGETSGLLFKGLRIDPAVKDEYKIDIDETETGKTYTYTYRYDGLDVNVEIEMQSVQCAKGKSELNQAAILSVWGVENVKVSGDDLSIE